MLTDEDPTLGARTHVHLELGSAQPIRILGEVVRKASMPWLGVAVRFAGMTLDDRVRLTDWIMREVSSASLTQPHPYSRKTARPALEEEPVCTPLDPSSAESSEAEPPVVVEKPSFGLTAVTAMLLLARILLYVGLPILIILLIGLGVGKFIDSVQIGP